MRPLWRDLILKVWGSDPLLCPCCNGTMKVTGTMIRHEEIEFFLRLHGLWQGIIHLPRPPPPPFDIEKRRGIGGVLDGGEPSVARQTAARQPEGQAKRSQPGARRESPPGGAGESNHRADRCPAGFGLGRGKRAPSGHLVGVWRPGEAAAQASGTRTR